MISIYKMAVISVLSLVGAISTYFATKFKKDSAVQETAEKVSSVSATIFDRPIIKASVKSTDEKPE